MDHLAMMESPESSRHLEMFVNFFLTPVFDLLVAAGPHPTTLATPYGFL